MSDDDLNDRRDDPALTPAQRELEDALRTSLSPAAARISRDRLLFEAGAAAARRSANRWRGAAAVLVLGNAVLLAAALRPGGGMTGGGGSGAGAIVRTTGPTEGSASPDAGEPPVPVVIASAASTNPARSSLTSMPDTRGYLSVRDAILRDGVSALPASEGRPVRTGGRVHLSPLDAGQLLGAPGHPPALPRWSPFGFPIRDLLFNGEHL